MMRIALQTCLTVMALLISASASLAAECADDPNECTLKKLCAVATTVNGGNTTWSTATGSAKHVSTAQSLGIECGITPIVDLCDTDPSECKLSQICGKATTDSTGQKSWDDSAEAYVAVAKEYGLSCDVSEKINIFGVCSEKTLEICSVKSLCDQATNSYGWLNYDYDPTAKPYVLEAKKRGLDCGVEASTCSVETPEVCSDEVLCYSAKKNASQTIPLFHGFVKEAKKRGLACGLREETAAVKKKCSAKTPEVCSTKALCYRSTVGGFWTKTPGWLGYVKEAKKRGLSCGIGEAKATNFKQAFTSEPKLYRQQLQYALKELGYYSYGADGLWGKGTSSGFDKFVRAYGLKGKTEAQVFSSLLSKVNVPSSFAAPKQTITAPKQTITAPKKTITDTAGLTAIVSNPSVTGRQALAMCKPQAQLAKRRAANSFTPSGTELDCEKTIFGMSCSERITGGAWGGALAALEEIEATKGAYDATLSACLAQYGWSD